MLNLMRRSANSWVIKTLLMFIALSFVIWGVGDYVNRESRVPVAEGGNWVIQPREFTMVYDEEFNQLKKRFGGVLDKKTAEVLGLKQRALNQLVNRRLIESAGRDFHLAVSAETLRKKVASNPGFLLGGQFDPERYRQLLRDNHLTPREFESQLAEEIVTSQIQQTVGTVVALPEILVQDVYRMDNEKRVVEMLKLKSKALEAEIPVTDEQLTAFLKEHAERFMHPVSVKVEYVSLDAASVKANEKDSIQVSPEEIKEYYDENSSDFRREERRRVSHILAQVTSEADEPGAKARVQQAQERLNKGEAFATVALALSDDVSKAKGGELGEFTRETINTALEEAAFSLPVGQVSAPIKSEFGYHLIVVTAIQAGETQSLAQVTPEIKDRLAEHKVQELVYERSNVLEDRVATSGSLQAVADDLKLHYRVTDFFSHAANGPEENKTAEEIEREEKFLEAAFATPAGETSPLVEVKEGQFAVLHVLERREPTPKTLDEAREAVTSLFRTEQAHQRATALMTKALQALQEGKRWEEAASIHAAIHAEVSEPFLRNGGKGGPLPVVRTAAFKLDMTHPLHTEVLEGLEELIVVRLQGINAAEAKEMDAGVKKLRPALEGALGQEQMAAFLDGLRREAKVKVYPAALDRF
ncbi:MAG: SurA N-terminal domain-containing protein [Magnetococcales bacterium]|nr:SurA N-terminal domain-containing protein [Magnetococcales bacterium]